ncbi:MAG: sorbosone dehydrogenase family protein [Acidobacteria bacterium]|nr:sorbosone dehydrogenase family protein [Acidobacteriota bacterium]MBV9070638.1 sorbosone dehydrogenase family protein [Acidobacteriota bacterium]MBV9478175.1 sorbosone dehydrogenase family protein [Acidobacteriota bacterium]
MKSASMILATTVVLACARGDAQPAAPPALHHYDIRAESMPRPYATHSAGNPPRVVRTRPAGAKLALPPGFHIDTWATDLGDPRNMVVAPNGDVFVTDTAGGRILIYRDANGDGKPEQHFTFASDVDEPFGLTFRGDQLYVGTGNAIVRYAYKSGQTAASGAPVRLAALPEGGHSTRNVIFNRDGSKMYVAVGSDSNVNDETDEPMRAAITEFNPDGSGKRIFASGLRNPIGLAWNPADQTLWTCVNERDGLGDDLVPDYATEVKSGAFYGWPFAYIGKHPEPRHTGEHPELVAKSIVPSLLIQAHSAPILMNFYEGKMFPASYRGGLFVALHGSWNRTQRTGYKVIFIPFRNGKPAGGYDDFVVGWSGDPEAATVWGRPAGVVVLRDGSLLVSDDGAGAIWRVTYAK